MAIVIEIILDRCSQCEYCIFDYDPPEVSEGDEGEFWGKHACTYGDPFHLPMADTIIPDNCPRNKDGI
jgi:hypothetical protein